MEFDKCFDKDEYSALNKRLFLPLRENGEMSADPSGWIDTHSDVSENPQFTPEIQKYYSDFYNQLNPIKKKLIPLLSEWDDISVEPENFTLCHSATMGSAIALAFLISKGIRNIILETPYYFATFYQAETFGLNIIRIPTFIDENFNFSLSLELISKYSPCAVFLTQPRTGLGKNQNLDQLKNLSDSLGKNNYIVIDEATEQSFPSTLSGFNFSVNKNILKIRSMFKGMGVNGVRLAFLIHHEDHRKEIAEEMEVMQGALDIYSLKLAVDIASNSKRFAHLLSVANNQILNLRNKVEVQIKGTNCSISPIVNGYIGSAIVKLPGESRRSDFLEYCAKLRMPIIIGSSMGFAKHQSIEFVRLNYFNRENHILNGLEIMSNFH